MLRATSVKARETWTGAVADTVVLDYNERHRRRVAMTGVRGLAFLLDLPGAVMLRGGDGLMLDDGRLVEVVAAPEPLAEIGCPKPTELVRIAWHLGNRHLPVQIAGAKLRIRRDHVIEEMVRGFGAKVVGIEAPFEPEGGAYATGTDGHPHANTAHDHDPSHHNHDHHSHDHGDHDRDRHDHDHEHPS